MYLLFEIADRDLIFILLALVGLIIFGAVIVYVVKKNNKVLPIAEDERFDNEEPQVELTEQQKQAKAELERVFNMMSADLEASEEPPSVIDEFERQQEENAIISYQELIKQAKAKGQIKEEMPIEEDYPKYEAVKPSYNKEEKKFKNSEIISPIFGVQGNSATTSKKENKDYSSNEKFLNSLKEFRENL